jgi:uncharacterized protein (TIGR03437 family)
MAAALLLVFSGNAFAATFGSVVPLHGHLSDIALDTQRRVVYAANFTANRIERVSMDSRAVLSPLNVAAQPSSVAMSPNGQWLVVGHYSTAPAFAGLTIINLATLQQKVLSLGSASVLTVEFGNSYWALVVLTNGVSLLDPATGTLIPKASGCLSDPQGCPTDPKALPVPWATYPPEILKASSGVSGDGNVIYALVDLGANTSAIVRYQILAGLDSPLTLTGAVTSPPLGPRVVSVDQTGATFLAGWVLLDSKYDLASDAMPVVNLAQFPNPPGVLNQGGHAFDGKRNLIYAQVAAGTSSAGPLLQVFDSDNLTVRETFQLRENLAGKALLDGNTMYAISDSGLTFFPVGSLSSVHRVTALQEDLLFQGDGCKQGLITQYLDIVDPGNGATDFTLTASSPGVQLSQASGTTPARVQVLVDPTAFQGSKGTASVSLQISSAQAVNVPATVRLLINTRDPDQQGGLYNVPGAIVDVLADPARDRFYVLRQDKNQVLVFDGTSFSQIAALRTGNTPVQMAIAQDQLLVTNDNSQIVSVFDLATLKAATPVALPSGLSARSIAVSTAVAPDSTLPTTQVLATARDSGSKNGQLVNIHLNLPDRPFPPPYADLADTGIFENKIDVNSALAASPSGNMIFMTMPDGTVGLYEGDINTFVASRKDLTSLSGAYAAMSDNFFFVGNHVLDGALVPIGQVDLLGGVSSGVTLMGGKGLLSSTSSAARSSVMEQFSMDQFLSISPVRTAESASTLQSLTSTPLGQIGQAILPFTRTLAPLANRQSIIQLSTSGFTVIPRAFDATVQPPSIAAITNAADPSAGLAPGALVSIWGSGLSAGNAAADSMPLAKGLGGVCLYAQSVALPLLYVSPNQINAQLPFDVPASAKLVLSNAAGKSNAFDFTVQPTAPAVFQTAKGTPVIIRTVDGQMITDQTPVHLNQILQIYMTGLGAVSTKVKAGEGAPYSPLATTIATPSITIGGAGIFTLWSGLVPGFVGLYQVNAQVPFHHIPTGSNMPLTITQGGASTTVKVRVLE